MDGSGIDFIVIPVIVVPCIAAWLIGMYYVNAHPTWKSGPSGSQRASGPLEIAAVTARVAVPAQRAARVAGARPAGDETSGSDGRSGVSAAAVTAAADAPAAGDSAT